MASDELEGDDGTAAAGKHEGRFFGDRRQQPVDVVGRGLHDSLVLNGAVKRAVR